MPARTVFLDTNGWLALLNSSDSLHQAASRLWESLVEDGASFVVTDWVIAETGNGLAKTPARRRFNQAVDLFRMSPRSSVFFVAVDRFERALSLYNRRGDKLWGLVDCASFVVMEEAGITEAFTNDHHFEQAGFRSLL
jgi:predicted nucleic acid-binding protein